MTYCSKIARPLGMYYNHYVSPSIRYQLVKVIITLDAYGLFESKFAYLIIFILFGHWYSKRRLGFAENFILAMPSHQAE